MELRARLVVLRAGLLVRAANRTRRRRLAAELAAYASEADLNDLHAVLDAYPDDQTHEIREILRRQRAGRLGR